MTNQRMIRQGQLIAHPLQEATVALVGVGMLGSWLAHSLARVVETLRIWDFDIVGPENIGTQAYNTDALGVSKADAITTSLVGFNVTFDGHRFPIKQSPAELGLTYSADSPLVVISAVDSFRDRRALARWVTQSAAEVFVDVRAHGTVAVVCIVPYARIGEYLRTLETDESAPMAACGMEGTAFVGMYVAAVVTAQLNQYFRGLPTVFKSVVDVAFGEGLHEVPDFNPPDRRYANLATSLVGLGQYPRPSSGLPEDRLLCPHCNSHDVDTDAYRILCKCYGCGYVWAESTPEQRQAELGEPTIAEQ